jgi:four helix bundle protein
MMAIVNRYRELNVYRNAFDAAMKVFQVTKEFPQEERYSMVDQMRRSSRSVCANLAESWRKRRYRKYFVSKLTDSESEAEETRVWLELAFGCGYLDEATFQDLDDQYDHVLAQLVKMESEPDKWLIPN